MSVCVCVCGCVCVCVRTCVRVLRRGPSSKDFTHTGSALFLKFGGQLFGRYSSEYLRVQGSASGLVFRSFHQRRQFGFFRGMEFGGDGDEVSHFLLRIGWRV